MATGKEGNEEGMKQGTKKNKLEKTKKKIKVVHPK